MMLFKSLLPLILLICIWIVPTPSGIEQKAWHLFAIFIATIAGILLRPLPMGAVALIGIVLTVLSGTLTITEALSGFGNRVIWLIVSAFMISRGFIKTGLGERIAYLFIAVLGKNSLGLAYGFAATDLVLAPTIPSNTARSGGVVFPIIRSTALVYDSTPDKDTERKIGSFLMVTAFQVQNITCAMFLTAMAANPLAVELAQGQGINISWAKWAIVGSVPGLISLLIIPYVIYKIYPPHLRETDKAVQMAREKLAKMGTMKTKEIFMLLTFFLLLILWILGSTIHLHGTTTALVGLSILILTAVLSWDDILSEKGAWNTLIWFAALVMMAAYLYKLGLIPWFSGSVKEMVTGIHWQLAFLILLLVYFYSHYFFASNTAHVSSMYLPFLTVALAVGTPAVLAALVLAFFSNLFSSTTHYGTGPAPVFFGAGYVELASWWKIGFLLSVVNIFIWLVFGGLWWKIVGLW